MAEATISMSKVVRQITLRVRITGARRTAIRTRVGAWLIGIAARVIGCEITIEMGRRRR